MNISRPFQNFFFGVVISQLKEKATSPFKYQHPLTKEWYLVDMRKISDDGIYQLLKLINPNYPKFNHILPASTKVLTSKQLTEHIQWIERWAGENAITLPYITEQWEKILLEAGIKKEKE